MRPKMLELLSVAVFLMVLAVSVVALGLPSTIFAKRIPCGIG